MTTPATPDLAAAREQLADIDWHLDKWTDPRKLARHLEGTHQQDIWARDADNLTWLLTEHGGAHSAQRLKALHELRAAERASGRERGDTNGACA